MTIRHNFHYSFPCVALGSLLVVWAHSPVVLASGGNEPTKIDLESPDKGVATEFVSHQGATEGYEEPPRFRISRQPAVLVGNGQYCYASIYCDPKNPKVLECLPYVAKLELGITGIIKKPLARIEIPLKTNEEIENYSFEPLLLRDIDQDGSKDLIVQFRTRSKPRGGSGSSYDDYLAFIKLPEFRLMYWGNSGHQGRADSKVGWKNSYYHSKPEPHSPIIFGQECRGNGCLDAAERRISRLCWDGSNEQYTELACSAGSDAVPGPAVVVNDRGSDLAPALIKDLSTESGPDMHGNTGTSRNEKEDFPTAWLVAGIFAALAVFGVAMNSYGKGRPPKQDSSS